MNNTRSGLIPRTWNAKKNAKHSVICNEFVLAFRIRDSISRACTNFVVIA